MSIWSDYFNHKITFSQAVSESGAWITQQEQKLPAAAQQDLGLALQAGQTVLSIGAGIAGTLAGPAVGKAVAAADTLMQVLTSDLFGSNTAKQLSVGEQAVAQQAGNAVIAVINHYVAQAQAGLVPTAPQSSAS